MIKVRLLMIDDSADDSDLMRLALGRGNSSFEFHSSLDPNVGLSRLKDPNEQFRLVLLDLKMPQRPGQEVLAEIRRTASTRHLPVIIFSSSDSPKDVRESYENGCSAYVKKPANFDEYRTLATRLEEFWGRTVTLP